MKICKECNDAALMRDVLCKNHKDLLQRDFQRTIKAIGPKAVANKLSYTTESTTRKWSGGFNFPPTLVMHLILEKLHKQKTYTKEKDNDREKSISNQTKIIR